MNKLLLSLLIFAPILVAAQENEFSYTYIDITATNAEGIGYLGDVYLGLPASLYIKGSIYGYLYSWNNLFKNIALGRFINLLNYDGDGITLVFDV